LEELQGMKDMEQLMMQALETSDALDNVITLQKVRAYNFCAQYTRFPLFVGLRVVADVMATGCSCATPQP